MPTTIKGATGIDKIEPGTVKAASLDGAQSGSAPIYGVRAWVSFDGTRNVTDTGASTNGQPVKIFGSGNVVSVIKISTGQFEITFNIAMPTIGYHWDWSSISLYNGVSFWEDTGVVRTTSKFRITTAGVDVTSVVDPARASVSVIC